MTTKKAAATRAASAGALRGAFDGVSERMAHLLLQCVTNLYHIGRAECKGRAKMPGPLYFPHSLC